MSDNEFDELLEETENAPACGSCLLLAEYLRADAAVIYRRRNGNVYPLKPIDGWRELTDTRWANKINIAAFIANPEVAEGQLQYGRIVDGIAAHRLNKWVEIETTAAERAKNELIQWREDQRAAEPDDEADADDAPPTATEDDDS